MNIYEELDYRAILRKVVKERKRNDPKCNFQRLAESARLPKSYLSKVVHGEADLSQDQLYLVNGFLAFTAQESEYMGLLLEYARCGLSKRKTELKQKIESIRRQNLETKEHIRASPAPLQLPLLSEYYLDPHMQIVHICLSIERYACDLKSLAADLRLHLSRVTSVVDRLEKLGIIERDEAGQIKLLVTSIHLPKESQLFDAWRNQIRLSCLKHMEGLPRDEVYSFSVTFSATPEVRQKIHLRFLDYLKSLEELVSQAPCEKAYQLNFDVFPWT